MDQWMGGQRYRDMRSHLTEMLQWITTWQPICCVAPHKIEKRSKYFGRLVSFWDLSTKPTDYNFLLTGCSKESPWLIILSRAKHSWHCCIFWSIVRSCRVSNILMTKISSRRRMSRSKTGTLKCSFAIAGSIAWDLQRHAKTFQWRFRWVPHDQVEEAVWSEVMGCDPLHETTDQMIDEWQYR